jgi:hypothetical protein
MGVVMSIIVAYPATETLQDVLARASLFGDLNTDSRHPYPCVTLDCRNFPNRIFEIHDGDAPQTAGQKTVHRDRRCAYDGPRHLSVHTRVPADAVPGVRKRNDGCGVVCRHTLHWPKRL